MTSFTVPRLHILTAFLALLLLVPTTDSQTTFNAELKNGVKGTPGVKARLTKKGFNYIGRIIGNLFAEQVPLYAVPDIAQSLPRKGGTIRLTDVRISKFQPPKSYQMSAAPPNEIRLTLINMDVTAVGALTGSLNILMPLDLEGELEVEAEEVNVDVNTALEKTSDGLPRVRLIECTARIGKIRVFNHNGGAAAAGFNLFQTVVARQARPVLQNLMCLRAKELIDRDLNNRLTDNPPVVSLTQARQIDLFGLEANQSPAATAAADQSATGNRQRTRRPLLKNGRLVIRREKRQISRRIPQSLPPTHVIVHRPRMHSLAPFRSDVSERSAGVTEESKENTTEQYGYAEMEAPPEKHNQSPAIMSTPPEASQFSPVFRAPAVRPPKPVRRPAGISRRTQKSQNLVMSEAVPPEQANLFAPSGIPAVGVPEEKVRRPSAKLPSVEVNRGETVVSDSTTASPSSSPVEIENERRAPAELQSDIPSPEPQRSPVVSEASIDEQPRSSIKVKPNNEIFKRLMEIFDLNETVENLFLDYSLVTTPKATSQFIEVQSRGEISYKGLGGTPFFPVVRPFPISRGEPKMLEVVVSDYLPNSLLYHANRLDLFNFHLNPESKDIGQFLWTTCDNSEVGICLGSFLPSLQKFPNREIHLIYKTTLAPAVVFARSSNGAGVMKIDIQGVLDVYTRAAGHVHHRFGSVDIRLVADAVVSLNGRIITAEVKFEKLNIKTHNEKALPQADLDDLGLIAQEALEGIVNKMLEEGIPVPLHPIFELVDPKVDILDRELLLSTDIKVNEKALKEMTSKRTSTPQRNRNRREKVKRRD